MHILIQGCGGENVKVTKIDAILIDGDEHIKAADDVIRKYLSDNELTSDITYEAADHPMGPGPQESLVGVYIADDLYWELWGI